MTAADIAAALRICNGNASGEHVQVARALTEAVALLDECLRYGADQMWPYKPHTVAGRLYNKIEAAICEHKP